MFVGPCTTCCPHCVVFCICDCGAIYPVGSPLISGASLCTCLSPLILFDHFSVKEFGDYRSYQLLVQCLVWVQAADSKHQHQYPLPILTLLNMVPKRTKGKKFVETVTDLRSTSGPQTTSSFEDTQLDAISDAGPTSANISIPPSVQSSDPIAGALRMALEGYGCATSIATNATATDPLCYHWAVIQIH